jgi:hypothetical protein
MKFLNLDRVIVISFGFFLVMNPTNVVQNILPTLMEEAGYD